MPYISRKTILLCLLAGSATDAAGVREHTRLNPRTGTAVTRSQAVDLTLTLGETTTRAIQSWVRTAGTLDENGKTLTAYLYPPAAGLVKLGQRVRAFPMNSRSSMYQARVTRILEQDGRAAVEVTLAGASGQGRATYLLEIVADQGEFLSIPNEAIIEEQDKHIVYVTGPTGDYEPREIQTGVQGELYTQVVQGLADGEHVVTIGSFFVDSEYKMKSAN